MKKIPLEETLGGAYRFLFKNVVSIVGTAWLPLVVFLGLCAGLVYAVVPHEWWSGNFPQIKSLEQLVPVLLPLLAVYLLILFLSLLMYAMIFTGLMRHSLGLKTTTTFAYFSLGAPVWRLIGAFIVAGVATIVVALLTVAAAAATIWAAQQYAAGIVGLVKFLAIAAAVLWMIYFCVRLFYFLPPVVVAEGAIALGRAWSLGSGNFWRVVALWLATFLPVVIVATILSGALFGIQENDMLMAMLKANSPAAAMHVAFSQYGLLLIGLAVYEIAYFTLMLGLGLGAMASAYKGAAAPEAA